MEKKMKATKKENKAKPGSELGPYKWAAPTRVLGPQIERDWPETRKIEVARTFPKELVGEARLTEVFGTIDRTFLTGLFTQLADAAMAADGLPDEDTLNFMHAILRGIGPRDPVECLIGANMGIVQTSAMSFALRLRQSRSIQQQEYLARTLRGLLRTFVDLVVALNTYRRSGGQNNVTVQNVSVNEGGQAAIVGTVTPSPYGSAQDQRSASPEAGSDEVVAPKPTQDSAEPKNFRIKPKSMK